MKPEIRFEGFEDEWEKKKIIDIAPLQRGFDLVKKNIVSGKYPIGYSNGILGNHNEFKAKGPGVFTGRSGTIGNVHYTDENYWPHNTSLWVTNFKGNHEKFIYYFYKNVNLKRYDAGSGVPTLNRNDVHMLKRLIPTYEEQLKIASFLTLQERKVEKQQEKIKSLEKLKKGMIQKIFSREIRFKDKNGGEFPEWDAIRFEHVVEKLIGGGTPSRKVEEYYGGDIPWVTVKDLKANKYISNAEEYITELGLKNSSSKIVDKDDLIIPTRMAVGRILIAKENVAINQDLKGCKLKRGHDTEFIYYLYASKSTVIERLGSGSTVSGINIEDLMKIKLEIPTLREQEKIAQYLCTLDIKLEKEKVKFKLLVEQKKGFMQRMFV